MPKFFYTHNVLKAPAGFDFIKSEFFAPTSSYVGIYATEVDEEIEKLKKSPNVSEISEAEFSVFLSKSQNPVSLSVVKQKTFMSPDDGKLTGRPAEVRPAPAATPVTVEEVITPVKKK